MTQVTKNIDSPLGGTLELTLTSGSHACVRFEEAAAYGVTHSGRFDIEKVAGAWRLINPYEKEQKGRLDLSNPYHRLHQALFVSDRWNGATFIKASNPARERLLTKLLPVAIEALESDLDAANEAEHQHLRVEIGACERELAQLAEQKEKAEKKLADLKERLANLPAVEVLA